MEKGVRIKWEWGEREWFGEKKTTRPRPVTASVSKHFITLISWYTMALFFSPVFLLLVAFQTFYIMKWELCVILNMNFIGRISKIAKHLTLRFYKPVFIPVKSDFLDAENSIFWRLKKHIFVFTPSKKSALELWLFLSETWLSTILNISWWS